MTKPCLAIVATLCIGCASSVYARNPQETCSKDEINREKTCFRSGSSRALLQVHSKAISFASELSEHETSTSGIGSTATLDDEGYEQVINRCCYEEMIVFMRRLLTEELGFEVCEEGWLSGVSVFFDCADDNNTFDGLVETLKEGTMGPCAGLAPAEPPGQCRPQAEDCPEFPNATPPPCSTPEAPKKKKGAKTAPTKGGDEKVGEEGAAEKDEAVTAPAAEAPEKTPPAKTPKSAPPAEAPETPPAETNASAPPAEAPETPPAETPETPPAETPASAPAAEAPETPPAETNSSVPSAEVPTQPLVTAVAPEVVSSAIGCFHYSYFAMKCKSSCPDGNEYVDASWPDCAVENRGECAGYYIDGGSMNYEAPNYCEAQCPGYSFITDAGQFQVQPEGQLLTPADVKMLQLPLGNHKKKRCNGDPWIFNGKTYGNLGTFPSSEECSNACVVEWACIFAIYRIDTGECSMMKGGVCHVRDVSTAAGGDDTEYDVWEKVCAS